MSHKDPIGNQLQALRKERKVSVPKLSVILKIPKDRIYKWEQGTASPKYEDRQILDKWIKDGNWKNVPREKSETKVEDEEFKYRTKITAKLEDLDALLSVIISELAALQSSISGENAAVLTKKIYKAAEDLKKISG